jgi:fatty acid desaturase
VGFVVDKVTLGQVSTEYFGFPCQFSFYRLFHNHHHHLSSGAGTIGQLVADVPSALSLTPPQKTKKKNVKRNKLGLMLIFT